MILYDSRAANSSSPRMRRAKTPFARCPCTKPAICAAAVNHPHHINPMNQSSNKCQPALINALIPVNPSIRRKRASSAACARPAPRRPRPPPATPSAVMRPKFLAQSHVISRNLSYNSRTCQPIQPPKESFQHESHLKPGLFGRIKQLNRGRLTCPYATRISQYALRNTQFRKSEFPLWTHTGSVCPAPCAFNRNTLQ